MANEVLAAVIQGGCGIIQGACTIAAAGIAVRGALVGLRNWQMEIPGKRRLELAESCLSLAYKLQFQIAAYGSSIVFHIVYDYKEEHKFTLERRRDRRVSIHEEREAIIKELGDLSSLTRLADVYFDEGLYGADQGLRKFFDYWNDMIRDLQRIDTSTPEGLTERRIFCGEIETIQHLNNGSADRELFHNSLSVYEKLLKPHLGVLAKSRDYLDTRRRRVG